MTPEEITRRNEAIALYMGAKWFDHGDGAMQLIFPSGGRWPKDLQYHNRWDDLMLVIEKMIIPQNPALGDLCIVPLGNGQVRVHFSENQTGTVYHYSTSMIEATWMAVSEWVLSRETQKK